MVRYLLLQQLNDSGIPPKTIEMKTVFSTLVKTSGRNEETSGRGLRTSVTHV